MIRKAYLKADKPFVLKLLQKTFEEGMPCLYKSVVIKEFNVLSSTISSGIYDR